MDFLATISSTIPATFVTSYTTPAAASPVTPVRRSAPVESKLVNRSANRNNRPEWRFAQAR